MVSSQRQVADHQPQVGNTTLLPGGLHLTLLVDTPDRTTLVGDLVTQSLSDRVDGVGETGSEDNEVKLPLPSARENDLVLCERFNVALLDLDLALDDLLTSTRLEVETTVTGGTKSSLTGTPLTLVGLETLGVKTVEHFFVEFLENGTVASSKFFTRTHGHGIEQSVLLFNVGSNAVLGLKVTNVTRDGVGERHDIGGGSLEKGDIDVSAGTVIGGVETGRRSTDNEDFFAHPFTGAVVRSRVTSSALPLVHTGDNGSHGNTTERSGHNLSDQ